MSDLQHYTVDQGVQFLLPYGAVVVVSGSGFVLHGPALRSRIKLRAAKQTLGPFNYDTYVELIATGDSELQVFDLRDISQSDLDTLVTLPVGTRANVADGGTRTQKYWDGTAWADYASGGAGSGDVVGPSASTNNELPLFSGTSGKTIKRSNSLTGVLAVTAGVVSALSDADLKTALDLGQVDNTSDADKPISTDVQTALDAKASVSPSVQAVTSAATVTPTFTNDMVKVTAQAAGLTLANPAGTAVEGWGIVIRIKDDGTSRSITYGNQYRAIGTTLPAATTIGKTLYLAAIWNDTDTKLDVVAVAEEE